MKNKRQPNNVIPLPPDWMSDEIRQDFYVGSRKLQFHWRSPNAPMGRFGGGWNWSLGVQIGGSTIIVNLLVCSLRIDRRKNG